MAAASIVETDKVELVVGIRLVVPFRLRAATTALLSEPTLAPFAQQRVAVAALGQGELFLGFHFLVAP